MGVFSVVVLIIVNLCGGLLVLLIILSWCGTVVISEFKCGWRTSNVLICVQRSIEPI